MTNQPNESIWSKTRWELLKGSIGVAFGAVAGVVALLYAPFGDEIQEWLDPTSVTVRGQITRGQVPAQNVLVMLDSAVEDSTGGQGLFWFEDVGKGRHDFVVMEGGQLALSEEFVVLQGQQEYPIGAVDLAAVPLSPLTVDNLSQEPHPAFALTPTAQVLPTEPAATTPTPTPEPAPTTQLVPMASPAIWATEEAEVFEDQEEAPIGFGTPVAGADAGSVTGGGGAAPSLPQQNPREVITLGIELTPISGDDPGQEAAGATYGAEARVDAPLDVLYQIDRVTYYLDPAFNPSVVTRYSTEDGFLLSFVTPGSFPLSAKVYLVDGTVVDLQQDVVP